MDIKKGTRIKNRYEILSLLGQGGFGTTYKAIDNLVNRFVAIKVSENDLSHEAKILRTINNVPHISHIYDYFTENGRHYLVMRLIQGTSLSSIQKDNDGILPINTVKQLLPSLIITLEQIHDYGVIHRDISPGNLILTEENTLYLIDFGTAIIPKQQSKISSLIFNHKGLDAPEKSDPSKQGPWTDVYSLCATIFYLLTGDGIPLSEDRLSYDPIPGILPRLSLNARMQNALIRGLAVDPAKRYSSIRDFASDFFGREQVDTSDKSPYSVHYHARTDIGTRPVNQDNFMVDTLFSYAGEDCEIKGYIDCESDELHIVALADGVASSNHGELASKASIQAVSHFIDAFKYNDGLPQNLVEEFLNQLNEKIIFLGNKLGKTASTLSLLLWKGNEFVVANIGDSPVYKLNGRKLTCLSTSHTLANEKLSRGEAISTKDLHSITAYLGKNGIAGSEMASFCTGTIEKGDIFLICSDGISGMTSDSEKIKFLRKDGDKAITSFFKCAHKHPKMDNCTAIILKF